MIFADKLVQLRKKAGWSQEELAEQMHVSRQSVSKWEGAQSVPDLEKVLRLSELFGVSTDYLLKDSVEEQESIAESDDSGNLRRVTMEEANNFLFAKEETSRRIALGVMLCIFSPIGLFILGAASENKNYDVQENLAAGIGMIVLLLVVAVAVALFVSCRGKTREFDYLEQEVFETEYGVTGMVRERKQQFQDTYTKYHVIGVTLCVLAALPLFGGVLFKVDDNDFVMACMLSLTMVMVGIGVYFFVWCGVIWASFEKLLQEGEDTKNRKSGKTLLPTVATVYWLGALGLYLGYSFIANAWDRSWIIWPVAAVQYPAAVAITKVFDRKNQNQGK